MKSTAALPSLTFQTVLWAKFASVMLEGRLGDSMDARLMEEFARLRDAGRVRIVVDCSKLEYLNSRGVSAFISVIDELREEGGDLKLVAVRPEAALIMDRLGVSALIQRFDSIDEAVRAFATPIAEFQSDGGLDIFVSSAGAKVFHASACKSVRRIKTFRTFASKKAARDAGLRACRNCAGSTS